MEIDTQTFATALRVASIVIERRNTIPILSHVMIDSGQASAVLRGTNLDQQLEIEVPTINGAAVRATIARPEDTAKLILAGNADTVIIEPDDTWSGSSKPLIIKSGELRGKMQTLLADDHPTLHMSGVPSLDIELGKDAIAMLLRVSGAMSREETRYYLNGVYIHHVGGWTWKLVATDGHRLFCGTVEFPGAKFEGEPPPGVIIPSHAIGHLRRLLPLMGDAPLRLRLTRSLTPNQVANLAPEGTKPEGEPTIACFNTKAKGFDTELATKLIDGTFPDYTRVVPSYDKVQQIMIKRADLRRALDGITAGMNEKARAVKLTYDPKGKLHVAAKWIDDGFDGEIAIDARTYHLTDPFQVGFNGRYLRSIVDVSAGEDLVITTPDAAAPGLIVDPSASDFLAVLMPMRV